VLLRNLGGMAAGKMKSARVFRKNNSDSVGVKAVRPHCRYLCYPLPSLPPKGGPLERVRKTNMRNAIDLQSLALPRVWQRGKVLGRLPQSTAALGLKPHKYFANRSQSWQSGKVVELRWRPVISLMGDGGDEMHGSAPFVLMARFANFARQATKGVLRWPDGPSSSS